MLSFAITLLEDAEAKATGGKKRKATTALAEALWDVRAQIREIAAAPDQQAFVANGCKPPAVKTPPVKAELPPSKPAAPTSIGSRGFIDAADIKTLMARPSAPSRKAAIEALTRHKSDVRRWRFMRS